VPLEFKIDTLYETRFRKEIFTNACTVHTPKTTSYTKVGGLKTLKEPHIFLEQIIYRDFWIVSKSYTCFAACQQQKQSNFLVFLKGFHNRRGLI
jgi:hypothetical protein